MKRILFAGGGTGGHLYPALALADAVRELRPDVEVHFVGAQRGVEARVLPQRHVPHTLLPLQPIQRDRVWRNWKLVPAMSATFAGLARLFLEVRPSLVVGTGGYASGPACMMAVLTGVPVALQEQNSHPGFTTRVLSRWARQVHLGFPEAAAQLKPGRHTQVFALGNPIQAPDATIDAVHARQAFGLRPDALVLLVVGGSQGSLALNRALLGAVERVARGELAARPSALQVLWATGPNHFNGISDALAQLGDPEWVKAVSYIEAMPQALAAADVAISRAGAMATAELLAWGIPMLLVPLPTAAADHQTFNARALESAGAAVTLLERDLTPGHLWQTLLSLTADTAQREQMAEAARQRSHPHAAREIAEHLIQLVDA